LLGAFGSTAIAQQDAPPPVQAASPAIASDAAKQLAGPLVEGLAVGGVTRSGRVLVRTDALMAARAADLAIAPAPDGPISQSPDAPRWQAAKADETGAFAPDVGRGGYLRIVRRNDTGGPVVMVLEASGHAMVYVNGEPRMGDPYGHGYVALPIELREGENELLFAPAGRGAFRASLRAPTAEVELETRDLTLPDIVRNEGGAIVQPSRNLVFGVPVRNCTAAPLRVELLTRLDDASWAVVATETLPPLSVIKLPGVLSLGNDSRSATTSVGIDIAVQREGPWGASLQGSRRPASELRPLAQARLDLPVVEETKAHRVTFVSAIDESAQYYAVLAPRQRTSLEAAPGLVLSLHGASVEAIDQARSYSPKHDLWIVCPTNRRPFGFDWEDWGRRDALEVLELAQADIAAMLGARAIDPRRIFLTGHSMGGHGTWQLASLFPDKFAAAAPSAGWISFFTYPQANEPSQHPMAIASQRAAGSSDTLAMLDNLHATPLFVLHGDADDNVPVEQARRMRELLAPTHPDFHFYEEPGAGHWWDSGEFGAFDGAACVDFPSIFRLFQERSLPRESSISKVQFTTVNPAISNGTRIVKILAQQERLVPSTVKLQLSRRQPMAVVTTTNVQTLELRVGSAEKHITCLVDGTELQAPVRDGVVLLWRSSEGRWHALSDEHAALRTRPSADLPGSFKAGYEGFTLVYGTIGKPEENAASFARARFDAEQWWVRGNGRARVQPDTERLPDSKYVVLYGNADTNRAWRRLVGAPDANVAVNAGRNFVRIRNAGSTRTFEGSDLALLAIHRIDENRFVTLVGTTGPGGDIASSRVPTFVAGAGIAEITLLRAGMLGAASLEAAWDGVLAAENAEDHRRAPNGSVPSSSVPENSATVPARE
jgi:poly(3-hydroxybutyrate) depolymerase